MISITCTHCSANLTMDEAFAGGVCRCQHCGTIQTVPAARKDKAGFSGAGATTVQQKALYQRRGRAAVDAGSGLDELADVVASSGLGGSGLTSGRLSRPAGSSSQPTDHAPLPQPSSNLMPLIIGGGVLILLLVGVIVYLIADHGESPLIADLRDEALATEAPTPIHTAAPSFLGIPLGDSVVYVVDRGSSTQPLFGYLKEATFRSVESLGGDRKFQIVFWDTGEGRSAAFPALMTFATKDNIAAVKRSAEDVFPFGQTDARPALELALKQKPAELVIATGKGWDLGDEFVEMVNQVRTASPDTKIHTVSLGAGAQSPALKQIAATTKGEYREVPEGDLRNFAQ